MPAGGLMGPAGSCTGRDIFQEPSYLPRESLRALARGVGLEPEQRVITYCGSGISASLGLFALHLAGYRHFALYDASWEEWGTYPAFPVELGEV